MSTLKKAGLFLVALYILGLAASSYVDWLRPEPSSGPTTPPDIEFIQQVPRGNDNRNLRVAVWREKAGQSCSVLVRSQDGDDVSTWIRPNGFLPKWLAAKFVSECVARQVYLSSIEIQPVAATWAESTGPDSSDVVVRYQASLTEVSSPQASLEIRTLLPSTPGRDR